MPLAYCTDCQDYVSQKNYSMPNNSMIKCELCGKQGGHITDPLNTDDVQNDPTNFDSKDLKGNKDIPDVNVIELKIEDNNDEGEAKKLDNFIPKVVSQTTTLTKDTKLKISLGKSEIRSALSAIDELGKELEAKIFDRKPRFYGSSFLNKLHDAMAGATSKVSKTVALPVIPVLVIGFMATFIPIPLMALSLFRKRKGGNREDVENY